MWSQYQLYRHKGTVFFKCILSSFLAPSSNPSPSPLLLPATWNVRSPASVVPPGLRHLYFLILPSTKHRLWEKSTPSSCLLDGRTNALYEFLPRTSQGCRLTHVLCPVSLDGHEFIPIMENPYISQRTLRNFPSKERDWVTMLIIVI